MERGPKALLRAHSTLVYQQIPDYGLDFDCVVEAKGKEMAVQLHRRKYGSEMKSYTQKSYNKNEQLQGVVQ